MSDKSEFVEEVKGPFSGVIIPEDHSMGFDNIELDNPCGQHRFIVATGDLLNFGGQIIVNAANKGGTGGSGIDAQINSAGGEGMEAERKGWHADPKTGFRIPEGKCRISGSHGIKEQGSKCIERVIHAVGPNMKDLSEAEIKNKLQGTLKNAYTNSLDKALNWIQSADAGDFKGKQLSIAFPVISGDIFRGNVDNQYVLRSAWDAIKDWLRTKGEGYEPGIKVYLVLFKGLTPQEHEKYEKKLSEIEKVANNPEYGIYNGSSVPVVRSTKKEVSPSSRGGPRSKAPRLYAQAPQGPRPQTSHAPNANGGSSPVVGDLYVPPVPKYEGDPDKKLAAKTNEPPEEIPRPTFHSLQINGPDAVLKQNMI